MVFGKHALVRSPRADVAFPRVTILISAETVASISLSSGCACAKSYVSVSESLHTIVCGYIAAATIKWHKYSVRLWADCGADMILYMLRNLLQEKSQYGNRLMSKKPPKGGIVYQGLLKPQGELTYNYTKFEEG